jgi:hypothetical protein
MDFNERYDMERREKRARFLSGALEPCFNIALIAFIISGLVYFPVTLIAVCVVVITYVVVKKFGSD